MPQLQAELRQAIEAGRIEARPSAEAIRRLLACSPARARALREAATTAHDNDTAAPAVEAASRPVPLAAVHHPTPLLTGADPARTGEASDSEREGAA